MRDCVILWDFAKLNPSDQLPLEDVLFRMKLLVESKKMTLRAFYIMCDRSDPEISNYSMCEPGLVHVLSNENQW